MIIRRVIGLFWLFGVVLGCASTVPVTKYLPEQTENVLPFFTAGQPIAAVETPRSFLLLSLEPTVLANRPYVRLWILYHNISQEPYLLEPLRFTSLTITSVAREKSGTTTPESPTKILADISNQEAAAMIAEAIGGTLQGMAARPTTVDTRFDNGSSARTTIYDQEEKRDVIADRTANAMANTAMWYDIYRNSLSDGILRRNTVFPGESVNGNIYLPIPPPEKVEYVYNERDPRNVRFFVRIDLALSGENQNIYFTPIEGE
jgi:hypothetical protein